VLQKYESSIKNSGNLDAKEFLEPPFISKTDNKINAVNEQIAKTQEYKKDYCKGCLFDNSEWEGNSLLNYRTKFLLQYKFRAFFNFSVCF
jgi:hypothetical protein